MPNKTPLTPDELTAIRERAKGATAGPWHAVKIVHDFVICTGDNYDAPMVTAHERDRNTDEPRGVRSLQEACANAKFLAASRSDIPRLLDTIDALQKFKRWVHDYLDSKGIPANPGGPHSKEGCRIGDRMDLVFTTIDALQADVSELDSLRLELAHMRTTDAIQDRQALLENNAALQAENAELASERERTANLLIAEEELAKQLQARCERLETLYRAERATGFGEDTPENSEPCREYFAETERLIQQAKEGT